MLRSITILTAIGALAWSSVALAAKLDRMNIWLVTRLQPTAFGKPLQILPVRLTGVDEVGPVLGNSWPAWQDSHGTVPTQQGLSCFSVFQQTLTRGPARKGSSRLWPESPQEMVHKLTHCAVPYRRNKVDSQHDGIPTGRDWQIPSPSPCRQTARFLGGRHPPAGSYLPLAEPASGTRIGDGLLRQKPVLRPQAQQVIYGSRSFGEW